MSVTSKIVLASSAAYTIGIVYYVHHSQKRDRELLHEGVLKDIDRERKKIQNIKHLQDQIKLTKILKKERDQADKEESAAAADV